MRVVNGKAVDPNPDGGHTYGGIADLAARELRVCYGGADTVIALASGDLDEIVEACLAGS
ncbi:MAG: hypothetical protein R6V03_03265 [Kiritimatiellia bacterium]